MRRYTIRGCALVLITLITAFAGPSATARPAEKAKYVPPMKARQSPARQARHEEARKARPAREELARPARQVPARRAKLPWDHPLALKQAALDEKRRKEAEQRKQADVDSAADTERAQAKPRSAGDRKQAMQQVVATLDGGARWSAEQPQLTDADRQQIMQAFDADADGKIDRRERYQLDQMLWRQHSRQRIFMLRQFDADRNGRLTPNEISEAAAAHSRFVYHLIKQLEAAPAKNETKADAKADDAAAAQDGERADAAPTKQSAAADNDR